MNRAAVITGIGCLSPNGLDSQGNLTTQGFFEGLAVGRSGIRSIERFNPEGLSCQIAAQLPNFNPAQWLSGKEVNHLPLTVPYAFAAAEEAFSSANLNPDDLSEQERFEFGVLIGSGGGAIELLERQYASFFEDKSIKQSIYTVPSNTLGTLSSELSMRFKLHGLSHVISTGCTSSTDAIGYAYHHIQAGRLKRVLCGGVDAPITQGIMTGFGLMKVLTKSWNEQPEKGSRPFSKDRDGFVLGEGAWLFIVEDKELALARNAKIYAEIKGYASTCEAYHRVKMADESVAHQARAMSLAMAEAGVGAADIDYIGLHGTATQLNDRIETDALKRVFQKRVYEVPASSVKSMIGHPQGASGAAGLASIIFAMEKGMLPPTINLDVPDPACDLDYVPEPQRKQTVEWAVCNCMGFGSKNSTLVIHSNN